MARITGVGGIFFKCNDTKSLAVWYRDVLGIRIEKWGGALLKPDPAGPPHLVWRPFAAGTTYFEPSQREFMVNFAVDDLEGMIAMLVEKGVKILGRDGNDPAGKFAWIMDPAGTKIELWEPAR